MGGGRAWWAVGQLSLVLPSLVNTFAKTGLSEPPGPCRGQQRARYQRQPNDDQRVVHAALSRRWSSQKAARAVPDAANASSAPICAALRCPPRTTASSTASFTAAASSPISERSTGGAAGAGSGWATGPLVAGDWGVVLIIRGLRQGGRPAKPP